MQRFKVISIGIDQSYKNCGISISADGHLKKVTSLMLNECKNNSKKRDLVRKRLTEIVAKMLPKAESVVCVIERIRLRSQGFLNIEYIKSIGALNAVIIDVMTKYGVPVYSVDTRCWKAQIVGTSKPGPANNPYQMEPEKYPTFLWLKNYHPKLLMSVFIDMTNSRQKKNIFEENNKRWKINDDACDSAAISLFYFHGTKDKLQIEK